VCLYGLYRNDGVVGVRQRCMANDSEQVEGCVAIWCVFMVRQRDIMCEKKTVYIKYNSMKCREIFLFFFI